MDLLPALRRLLAVLRRRHVWRVAIAYITGAWVTIQFGNDVLLRLGIPDSVISLIVVLAIAGFPLALAFAWLFEVKFDEGPAEDTGWGARGRGRRLATVLLTALAASGTIGASLWWAIHATPPDVTEPLDPTGIAVLYPETVVGGPEALAFGNALTQRLIDGLGSLDAFRVISAEGVRQFRNQSIPPDSIARILDVGTLITVGVEALGDSLRVAVRLVNGVGGEQIGAYVVTSAMPDRLSIFGEVATNLTEALREGLGRNIQLRRSLLETKNVDAFELFRRAEERAEDFETLIERGDLQASLRALSGADSLLVEAAALDPDWIEPVVARGMLADRQAILALFSDRTRIREWLKVGENHAVSALQVAPNDGRALHLRGLMRFRMVEYDALSAGEDRNRALELAEVDLRAAIGDHPRPAQVLVTLSQVVEMKGERIDALVLAERAYEQDAYLQVVDQLLRRLFDLSFQLARDDEAVTWCHEGRRRFPTRWEFLDCRLRLLGGAEGVIPDAAAARAVADTARSMLPTPLGPIAGPRFDALIASVHARAGDREGAQEILDALPYDRAPHVKPLAAAAWLLLEERAKALELLTQHLREVPTAIDDIARERTLKGLGEDEDLRRLLRRSGQP